MIRGETGREKHPELSELWGSTKTFKAGRRLPATTSRVGGTSAVSPAPAPVYLDALTTSALF